MSELRFGNVIGCFILVCLTCGMVCLSEPAVTAAADAYTPLMKSCGAGGGVEAPSLDVVAQLLREGQDPTLKNRYGWSALDYASIKKYPEVTNQKREELADLLAKTSCDKGRSSCVFVTERETYVLIGQSLFVEGRVKNFGEKSVTKVILSVSCPVTGNPKAPVRCTPDATRRVEIGPLAPGESKVFRIEAAEWYPGKGTGETSRYAIYAFENQDSPEPVIGFVNPRVEVADN